MKKQNFNSRVYNNLKIAGLGGFIGYLIDCQNKCRTNIIEEKMIDGLYGNERDIKYLSITEDVCWK